MKLFFFIITGTVPFDCTVQSHCLNNLHCEVRLKSFYVLFKDEVYLYSGAQTKNCCPSSNPTLNLTQTAILALT